MLFDRWLIGFAAESYSGVVFACSISSVGSDVSTNTSHCAGQETTTCHIGDLGRQKDVNRNPLTCRGRTSQLVYISSPSSATST